MQSLEDLIDPISEATNSGGLVWEEDGPTKFSVSVGNYTILIWQWADEDDGSSGISVGLKEKGHRTSSLDSIVANEYSARYDRVSEFYGLARRSALKVDKIISDLKNDLKALRVR